jgi:hypothetical protein
MYSVTVVWTHCLQSTGKETVVGLKRVFTIVLATIVVPETVAVPVWDKLLASITFGMVCTFPSYEVNVKISKPLGPCDSLMDTILSLAETVTVLM